VRGQQGNPREWIFIELARMWYVREAGWKLTQTGDLFDMSDAPFTEKPVAAGTMTPPRSPRAHDCRPRSTR